MELKRSSIEKMSDGIGLFFQGIGEVFPEVVSVVSKVFKQIDWKMLAKVSNDPEIKKYFAIYRRTKNSRIKKKQLKKIKAKLYGDML
ncbi:hypothetical protein [Enterococcus gallinarum]